MAFFALLTVTPSRTASALTPHSLAATARNLAAKSLAARCAALAHKSVPALAAVAGILGSTAVSVACMRTLATLTPNTSATVCTTLVCKPCPISVPPCCTVMLPSFSRLTSAVPWLCGVKPNATPNMTGVSAKPRLMMLCLAFQLVTACRRAR